ncbi:U-scoloptoxin(11)-Sm7a-like [Chelonus insularis]|uniref:U-scoloptoxin(11)-Sm7a-like n=1 Tax=Chelonus insularis TaxID=460826 RepID=UPI00158D9BC1|nr:U-scoloptoxin(11)-Sm7a-like [Chelonus insularis]
MQLLILLSLLITYVSWTSSNFTRILSKPNNIVFKYGRGATGERTLYECGKHEACNVIHRRFWMPNLAERLCRCPNGDECPWTDKIDDFSIPLNNRAILKFCEPVENKGLCKPRQTAATVYGEINDDQTYMVPYIIDVDCICPSTHYWKLKKYDFINNRAFQIYRCAKQRMCYSYEFCGFVREDFFSIYYRCSCPEGNLCVNTNKNTEIVQELMYLGPAFRAYCDPWNKSSRVY